MNLQSTKLDLSSLLALGFFLVYLAGGIYFSLGQQSTVEATAALQQQFTCESEKPLADALPCQKITGL